MAAGTSQEVLSDTQNASQISWCTAMLTLTLQQDPEGLETDVYHGSRDSPSPLVKNEDSLSVTEGSGFGGAHDLVTTGGLYNINITSPPANTRLKVQHTPLYVLTSSHAKPDA